MNDKRILLEGDIIKLNQHSPLFKMTYMRAPPNAEAIYEQLNGAYYIGGMLGAGGCGVVRAAYDTMTLKPYAMKIIEKHKGLTTEKRMNENMKILDEILIMKTVEHNNLLSLVGSFEDTDRVAIVMEMMRGGDLLNRIIHSPGKHLSEADAKFFMYQACCGIQHLHSKGIVHRDIKPDNILLSDAGPSPLLKLSDFGLSKNFLAHSIKTTCGTHHYIGKQVR